MKLIIAGIVQDREYFETLVAPFLDGDQICYLGSAGPEVRDELMGNAYALLHPISFDEPFGLSVIEAMACGTPVVAVKRGSMPEIIAHGVTGYLVRDSAEMATMIPQIGQLDRSQCRKWVEERFSVDRMVDNYLEVYNRILQPACR